MTKRHFEYDPKYMTTMNIMVLIVYFFGHAQLLKFFVVIISVMFTQAASVKRVCPISPFFAYIKLCVVYFEAVKKLLSRFLDWENCDIYY